MNTRTYRCHCCGRDFRSDKPQDPERDRGFGTCDGCHAQVAADWAKCGFAGRDLTIEKAHARLAQYA